MKVEILDAEAFSGLDPEIVQRYLRSNGWSEEERSENGFSIWQTADRDRLARVWLPLDKEFIDFEEGIQRLVREFASFEEKSQLEVLEDLNTIALGDIIRLTTFDLTNRASTSIPILDGVALVEKAKRIATAAALTVDEKKPVHSTYRPPTVAEYLDKVRLGQTERGSYRIKLISPLPIQPSLLEDQVAPFERRVVTTLMDSLDALKIVSKEALRKGRYRFESFREAVEQGVSANLCEALTDQRSTQPQRPIQISVSWSDVVKAPKTSAGTIEFDSNVLYFVEQAGKDFREHHPERVVLRGLVGALKKDSRKRGIRARSIVVVGLIEDRFRSVHIELGDRDAYDRAIDAHKAEKEVLFSGILVRKGTYFKLNQPQMH